MGAELGEPLQKVLYGEEGAHPPHVPKGVPPVLSMVDQCPHYDTHYRASGWSLCVFMPVRPPAWTPPVPLSRLPSAGVVHDDLNPHLANIFEASRKDIGISGASGQVIIPCISAAAV